MAYTDDIPPPAPALSSQARWEACDHCQAPLDERQRYCVACGARRAQADDPAARYFVAASRRARQDANRVPVREPAQGQGSNIRTALLLALLPVVAAVGIFVGRGSGDDNQLLVEALKAQKAPVVNVGSGGGAATAAADDEGGKAKGDDGDATTDAADGEVIGRGAYGTARKLTGAKATPEQLDESKKAIEKIVNSKGKEYVEQQRGLPDQIIIP